MKKRSVILASFLFSIITSPLAASQFDGMNLSAVYGLEPGSVMLRWTGGEPDFTVYRSGGANLVVAPGSQIGVSTVRSWLDSSPTGRIAYYVITSPCVYAPPEVCDGIDNDCDGTIDGPGSEGSCNLANAGAVCSSGACAIAACNSGFGDCDGVTTNGCETDTHVAQSTSPESLWIGDPNPDKDLRPGYQRVATITNCGACGSINPAASCDDGIGCTTDLCVPVGEPGSQIGTCRHYDRAQCAEARCGGSASTGTPPPRDAACTGADTDGDGLNDDWESPQTNPYSDSTNTGAGVDINCDGAIDPNGGDLIWHDPPAGPVVPDIYLQYDYMAASATEPSSHAPQPQAIDDVVSTFAANGIVLHVDPNHQALPHASVLYFPVQGPDSCAIPGNTSFYAIKANPSNFEPRRLIGYHYFIFGHDSCEASNPSAHSSGISEIFGNDAVVTLGGFTYTGTPSQVSEKRVLEEAGTLLHELGHNIRLCHGGSADPNAPDPCAGVDVNRKTNYMSSMNYSYQLGGILRATQSGTSTLLDPNAPRRVDFSHVRLDDLNEGDLDETQGLNITTPPFDRDIARYFCAGSGGPVLAPGHGPVDWDCDGVINPMTAVDLNDSGTSEILNGANDWATLSLGFQCRTNLTNIPLPPALVARDELTLEEAESRRIRADSTAYCNPGFDDCDGNPANGCETPVGDDPDNCGGCGQVCSGNHIARSCSMGVCNGMCDPGFGDCDSDKRTDGCEVDASADPANCGACGRACSPAGDSCQGGVCVCGAGASCDALFCAQGATCNGGSCAGGTPRDCSTGETCSVGSCNEAARQCDQACTTSPCWVTGVGDGAATAPASDASFNPPQGPSYQYVAKGTRLYALRNVNESGGSAGTIKWEWNAPATIQNFPSPVPLSNGGEYLFAAVDDGHLYKLDASDGSMVASADARRSTCATDRLMATPAVQLYRFSDPNFRTEVDSHPGHQGDDVVIVFTKDQCNDSTSNKVLAYYASDLSVKWIFNATATKMVDFGSDGCALDYATDTLYCGSDLPSGRNQNTLWAIDTITGALHWSYNAGPILNRPMLNFGPYGKRLYVANAAGSVQAFDPNGDGSGGGRSLWTQPVALPGGVTRPVWPEFRPGDSGGVIIVLDDTGIVRRVDEAGTRGILAWSTSAGPGGRFVSMSVTSPSVGKLYAGRDDGMIQQIDIVTGKAEVAVPVASPADSTVYDPSLDVEGGISPSNRMAVATGVTPAGSQVTRFCVPWATSPGGGCHSSADCAAWGGPCAQAFCSIGTGVCHALPFLDGTSCVDPNNPTCSTNTVCLNGVCSSGNYANCLCANPGDRACTPGTACCGSFGGCVNLESDSNHCGACGTVCGAGQKCVLGSCQRDAGNCPAGITLAGTLSASGPALAGADAIAYDHTAAGECSAYVTTYASSGASRVKKISPPGAVTQATVLTADQAPVNGLDVARAGDLVFATMVNRPPGQIPLATPGMATGTVSSGSVNVATTAHSTSSSTPFSDTRFDQGPVGPALNYIVDPNDPGQKVVYYGNWMANGDLYQVGQLCAACPWTASPVSIWSNPTGERITAIAFELGQVPGPAPVKHRNLYVAHGTVLSVLDLDMSVQTNVDASPPSSPIDRIMSITCDPYYGDIYMEVRGPGPIVSTFMVVVREDDHSVRALRDVHLDLRVNPPAPPSFPNEGRICASSGAWLERMVPNAFVGSNPDFLDIFLIP